MAWFTEFQGLRELGVIAGLGLLLCYVSMALVLPALLIVSDRAPRPRLERLAGTDVGWADRLGHRPVLVVALATLFSLLLIPFSRMMHFERNVLELQATNFDSAQWERRIAADSDSASWFAAAVVDTREEVADLAARAAERPHIGRIQSVNSVLGLPDPQRDRLRQRLQDCEVESVEFDEATVQSDLAAISASLESMASLATGQEQAVLLGLVDQLHTLESREESTSIQVNVAQTRTFLEQLREGDRRPARDILPTAMRDEFMAPSGRYLVKMHPREDVWDYEAMGRFISDVRAVAPDATGVPVTHYEALDSMREAFVTMMILAVVLIGVITALTFRNVMDVTVCLLTLGIGLWWTVGAMAILGVSFNLANFFAAPILVGLGIDGSIHMVHRWREGGPNRLCFGGTRRAVVLTSMTTMIGFGCLVIAEHRGLRSLGIVMALGSAACMIAVVVVLPSLLALREKLTRA